MGMAPTVVAPVAVEGEMGVPMGYYVQRGYPPPAMAYRPVQAGGYPVALPVRLRPLRPVAMAAGGRRPDRTRRSVGARAGLGNRAQCALVQAPHMAGAGTATVPYFYVPTHNAQGKCPRRLPSRCAAASRKASVLTAVVGAGAEACREQKGVSWPGMGHQAVYPPNLMGGMPAYGQGPRGADGAGLVPMAPMVGPGGEIIDPRTVYGAMGPMAYGLYGAPGTRRAGVRHPRRAAPRLGR